MIAYKCGQCRGEMESPEVMKEKLEVCPSCGTLNRVPSAARLGGTVHCARCHDDFSREDKVKFYDRELVCDKCAAFLEDIEKVALPEATDMDLASPPPRAEPPADLKKIMAATRTIVGAIVFAVGGVIATQVPKHMSSGWLFIVFLGCLTSVVGVDIWKGGWPFGKWKDGDEDNET